MPIAATDTEVSSLDQAGANTRSEPDPIATEGGDQDPFDRPFVLNPYLVVIRCSDDEVLIKHGSRSTFSETIFDESRSKLLGWLLHESRAPTSVRALRAASELDDASTELVGDMVAHLRERSVLVDPALDLARIYIQMTSPDAQAGQAVSETTIGLVGGATLGTQVATSLVAFNPRALLVLDGRTHAHDDGEEYAAALARQLAVTGYERVDAWSGDAADPAALGRLFTEADFVIVAWESFSPSLFHVVNEAAIKQRTPWLLAYCDGSEAVVGPTVVPGESPCYYEFEIQSEACIGLRNEHLLYKEHLFNGAGMALRPVPPPFLQVAAGLASTSALRFISTGRSFTVGRAVRVEFEGMSIDYQDILRLPRCPACTSLRPAYRNLFL